MKQFMPELATPSDRLMQMQSEASKVEKTTYQKQLTPDELAARREDLCDDSIKLNNLEDELKAIKDAYADKMNPLKIANKVRLTEIKTRQTTVDGTIYHIPDMEDNTMNIWDEKGEWVSGRRLRPEEKIGTVFAMNKVVNS